MTVSVVARQEPVVQKCLGCLREAVSRQMDNLYTSALLSYTFTLAGDQEMRSKLITYLHQKSSSKGKTGQERCPLLVTCSGLLISLSPPQEAFATGSELGLLGRVWTPWRWR